MQTHQSWTGLWTKNIYIFLNIVHNRWKTHSAKKFMPAAAVNYFSLRVFHWAMDKKYIYFLNIVHNRWKTQSAKKIYAGSRCQLLFFTRFSPICENIFYFKFLFPIAKIMIYGWAKFHQFWSTYECFVFNWKKAQPFDSQAQDYSIILVK